MQQPMQPIIQHLFQVSSLEDLSRQRLEDFVAEYPSFGIGHYLLSRKLKAEESERFAEETRRTNLYFTNPFWLQWQLDHVAAAVPVAIIEEPVAIAEEPEVRPEPVAELKPEPVAEVAESYPAFTEPVLPMENVVTVAEETLELPAGDDLAEALGGDREEPLTAEEKDGMTAGEGEAIEGVEDAAAPAADAGIEPTAAERLLRSIEEARELRGSLEKINTNFEAETGVAGEDPIKDEEPPFVLEETEEPAPPPTLPVPGTPMERVMEPMAEPVTEPVEQAVTEPVAQSLTEPAVQAVTEPALVFEPFHTIDYFASQGIKLTLDENPSDQLGKQLKSFTDWLKSMRRLPQKDREVVPDRVAEQAIQSIAAHSIEGKEVVTETMAEVLAKQGMREKARVVYEKLSLLNPDKSAYFAAKIEQLNIH